MTDVIYPTADFAADEFHQKYGFNDIKSDAALTLVAMGNKTLDTGFAMNELSKGIVSYDEAHNKPAADKFINSYNTVMDQYNTVLQHSNHPIAKVVGGVGGFIGQPAVAAGGLGLELGIADAGAAIKGAGLSSFIGEKSAGFMANLGESRLAAVGGRSLLTATEAAAVTVPEAISHAYLAQSTPIRDDYNYMDVLREVGQNFLVGGLIHLAFVEPIKAGVKHFTKKYTPPVQVATSESMRKAAGKVEQDLMNEQEPNARAELHQGFNDQRNSGRDPTVEEVRASAADVRDQIAKTDSKIKDLQKEAKEPVEPTKPITAMDIGNRIARIETKPEELRTDLERKLLKTLPKNETTDRLKSLLPKHELEIDEESGDFLKAQRRKKVFDVVKEREKIAKEMQDFKTAKEYLKEKGIVPEWGTRNEFLEKNPLLKDLLEMKKTGKFDEDIIDKAERWEMKQVLKDKPTFISDTLKNEELQKFAEKHPDIIFKDTKEFGGVLAKNKEALDNLLKAKNQREIGRALGYKDIGVFGEGKVRAAAKEFKEFFDRTKEEPKTAVIFHDEAALQKIDALEDQRANMNDILDNHQEALDILQEPKTAVDPKESDTKPLYYSDTDPISDAEKITPEEETSGRPEGLDIKESEFTEKGKQELEAVREEKQELGNYDKLMKRIVECITNFFYK